MDGGTEVHSKSENALEHGPAGRSEISGLQRLDIFPIDFYGDALHDVLQRENHTEAVFLPDHDAFHAGEGTRSDAGSLPHREQGVRLGGAQLKAGSQRVDCGIRQWSRLASRSAHNGQGARHIQHAHAFVSWNMDEDITGKQRQIQGDPGTIAPFAFRPIKGEIELDLPLAEILGDTLLVARSRIHSEPLG